MPTSPTTSVIEHFRRAVLLRAGGLGDGELLGCFIERHDEAALAALVERHGPMVWGVCRRLLSHHDDEDAFQATFLVLVRKAASIVPRGMVGNWLYGVAHQTALQARRTAARRKAREVQVTEMPDTEAVEQDLWNDVRPLLDQELSRLSDNYRAVIVLCDLEGRTRKEVARQLGVPEGTVAGRLARARALLAKRLAQRGVTLSGGALAAVLARNAASAGAPISVVSSTLQAATLIATGHTAAAGAISVQVAALTEGVLKVMLMSKLKVVIAVLLVLGFLTTGATVLTLGTATAQSDKPPVADKSPIAEGTVTPLAKQKPEPDKDGFTAWGKEAGGLQAGLGVRPGQKRAYHHGETVKLVVRVRNVGKEAVKFQYVRQFLIETPPTVTDADGKPVPQPHAFYEGGEHIPVEVTLAPGKEIELAELNRELRPTSESGNKRFSILYGTGKVQIQYERVFGNSSSGTITLDPTLSKLATGKLELEIKSDAEVKSDAPFATEKNGSAPEVKKEERTPVPYLVLNVRGSDGLVAPCTLTEFDANRKARWSVIPGVDLSGKTKRDGPLLDLKDKATQQAVIASVRDYLSQARKNPNAPHDLRVVFGTDAPPDGFPVWALKCCLDAGFGEVRFTGYVPSGGGYIPRLAPGPDGEAPGYKRYRGQLVETNKLITDYAEAFRRY